MKKPNAQKGKSVNSLNEKPTCAKCKKEHIGECLEERAIIMAVASVATRLRIDLM